MIERGSVDPRSNDLQVGEVFIAFKRRCKVSLLSILATLNRWFVLYSYFMHRNFSCIVPLLYAFIRLPPCTFVPVSLQDITVHTCNF